MTVLSEVRYFQGNYFPESFGVQEKEDSPNVEIPPYLDTLVQYAVYNDATLRQRCCVVS